MQEASPRSSRVPLVEVPGTLRRRTLGRVLMVAFHFPPQRGSSGIQRTLRFARYLPEFGWEPHVLTAHTHAYEQTDESAEMLPTVAVHRAFAFDASRDFSVRGRYPSMLARPDRWVSWWLCAVPLGVALIRRLRPDVLWSTYPIATAHLIGHTLARLSGVPWVADFRDPMAQDGYPSDAGTWRAFKRIEADTVQRAAASVFTSPGAADEYRSRYPSHADRICVIENGYDHEMFENLRGPATPRATPVLLHSGIVYPSERDPTALFRALRLLRDRGIASPGAFIIRFRGPVHDAFVRQLAASFGVADLIEIGAMLPYREALTEMLEADALLVLQAANCNQQIPAKVYEYLRAGRAVIGLADPVGDTAGVLRAAGIRHIAALENAEAIAETLKAFVEDLSAGRAAVPDQLYALQGSRRARTSQLAETFNRVGLAGRRAP
jgi:glycosyltransferase involved in cell wall biosynthesis